MTGDVTESVAHESGAFSTDIMFSRGTEVPIEVTVTTTLGAGFPGDGVQQVVDRLVGWVAGTWRSGVGDFDVSGLQVGEGIDTNRILAPVLSVPGQTVTSVTVQRKAGGGTPIGTVTLTERLTLAAANVTVTVSA